MIHWRTKNKSFVQMHFYLKNKGLQNNTFFLTLINPELEFVDPHDPNLTTQQKAMVLMEVLYNYWYFLREVVRVQTPGGASRYALNPALLAFHFLSELNCNIYFEIARQIGKTTAVLVRKLYTYNFKARHSKILFFHQDHPGSKRNLEELKKIIADLPPYLRMESAVSENGKKLKARSRVESIKHVKNGNSIITMPGASSPEKADTLGRGTTATEIYWDEHAFIKYNDIIYTAVTPAFNTAANLSAKSGNPYGMVITTTAGSRNREYAEYSYQFKNVATPWNEAWYDMGVQDIYNIIQSNSKSVFVYVKYQYDEMGYGREWLEQIIRLMNNDWKRIRREYLLEWEYENNNSPFSSSDLEILRDNKKKPIRQLRYGTHVVNVYEEFDQYYLSQYIPIIGVDVSSTEARNDSSTITVIDSYSTKVIATFNSNFVSGEEFSNILVDLVVKYYPTAIVNIETNGGFADMVISTCKKYIRSNLYYEVIEKVIEERSSNYSSGPFKKLTRRYGINSNSNIRNRLIEILYNRVSYHKDKFMCPVLIDEVCTMEEKKNGKIEHSVGNHDDQVFSYLMALYVYYHGKDVAEIFGLRKYNVVTDDYSENDEEFEIDDEIKNKTRANPLILSGLFGQFEDTKVNQNPLLTPTNNFVGTNNNVVIPQEYKGEGAVYTLENHLLNGNSGNGSISNNNNLISNFYDNLDTNNNNKNFWE